MLDDDRVDRQARLKSDFIQGAQIGGVSNRHREPVAALVERDDLVGRNQLAINRILGDMRFVESGEVEQWITKGIGNKARDIDRRCLLACDDLLDQGNLGIAGLGEQLLRLRLLELSGLNQCTRQAA